MKSLIVYYSLEGNTKFIAEEIAREIDCDVIQLKLQKELPSKGFMKYLLGGKQVVFNEKPALEPFNINIDNYDLIIMGTPVWAGKFASAFNTFFSKISLKNKKIVLFCCYGGNEGKTFDSFKRKLEGNKVLGQMGFRDPLKKDREENIKKAREWIRQFVK